MKVSLKIKTIMIIAAVLILLSVSTLTCYYRGIDDIVRTQFGKQSVVLAHTIALSVDADMTRSVRDAVMDTYRAIPENQRLSREKAGQADYQAYISRFSDITKMADYNMLETSIRKIMEETQVYDLRLCWADPVSKSVIYLVDASSNPKYKAGPGSFVYAVGEDRKVLDAPALGFKPRMTNSEEFGWLMTTAQPLYDQNFHVIGFAEISIDMNTVVREMHNSARNIAIILLLIILATGAFVTILVERSVVKPINMLSDASVRYYNKDKQQSDHRTRFSDLDIHTGDEIETLARSMALMETDIEDYISSLTRTRNQLNTTREYAEEMDRIAYYDALTGVRNKRAYHDELKGLRTAMMNGDTDFGIAVIDLNDLKYYNDTFGHEKGDAAICTICNIICEAFAHSPVFRYGGDEFAVILKGQDLQKVDELIARMKDRMDKLDQDPDLPPWGRVKAAIGYAICDPAADKDPDTVFKRADKTMYENKKKMKSAKK